MSEWTDELKAEVVEAYVAKNPTPENSMEIVKELAEQFDKTANGIRMILSKEEVYVKKTPAAAEKKEAKSGGSTRVSKADAIKALSDSISANGAEVDEEILSKLTGKAAMYLKGVIDAVAGGNED